MSKQINLAALQSNPAVVEALLALLGGKAPRKTRSDKGFTKQAVQDAQTTDERKAAFAAATVAAFAKAGFPNVTPKVDVMTYGKLANGDKPATGWLSVGRKVKAGEKSIRVKAKGMAGKGIPHVPCQHDREICDRGEYHASVLIGLCDGCANAPISLTPTVG
jgi:hypothetical protein